MILIKMHVSKFQIWFAKKKNKHHKYRISRLNDTNIVYVAK